MRKRQHRVFQIARHIHAYGGLAICVVLLLISVSGTLLVFKDDYVRLTIAPDAEKINLSTEALASVAHKAEIQFPDGELRALVFGTKANAVHKAYLIDQGYAYLDHSGDILSRWRGNERAEHWLFDLHHQLLTGRTGGWIAGLVAIAASAFVIGGVIAYWPARRGWRRGLKISGADRLQLLSLHRNLGILSAIPILLLLLTGAALSFPQTTRNLLDQFGGAPSLEQNAELITVGEIDWQSALGAAQTAYPTAKIRLISWPRQEGQPVSIRLRQDSEWHPNGRTVVSINPASSKIVTAVDAQTFGPGRRIFNGIYPIHAGGFAGRPYDLFLMLVGIALSVLSTLGVWAFVKK